MNKYRCKECGSENLVWRGYMVWDFESQKFEKVEVDYELIMEMIFTRIFKCFITYIITNIDLIKKR